MDLLSIIGSIGGGAFTGLFGSVITGYANYKMKRLDMESKKSDQVHELAMVSAETEAMIAETKAQIEVTKEKTRGEVEKAEIGAFTESLKELKTESFKESYMERLEKAGRLGRFAVVLVALAMAGVDVVKKTMRPFLTYYLIGATTWVTYMAYEILRKVGMEAITQEWAEGMFLRVTLAIIYLTITCVTWWFADRRMAKFLAEHLNQGGMK